MHTATYVDKPRSVFRPIAEVFAYRELVWVLVLRDIQLRYRQTVLGIVWVAVQSVGAGLIFTVIFGRLAKIDTHGVPYLPFVLTGLVAWALVSNGVSRGATSLTANIGLITKIYFPRQVLPLASVAAAAVDALVALVLLLVVLVWQGFEPTWRWVAAPLFLAYVALVAFGASLWLSALSAFYRDVTYALPFLLQVWLFATPIVYPTNLVPHSWVWLFSVNPMVLGVEGMRWTFLPVHSLTASLALASLTSALILAVSGWWVFRSVERRLADVI